jgi:phosphoribosylanthranilate isomerase
MVRVKICGITRLEDGLLAAELGASALGFVFWPKSPRFIDPHRARDLVAALPPMVTPIGVFVDHPSDYVEEVAGVVRLGAIQLHGRENPGVYAGSKCHVIKSVAVTSGVNADEVDTLPPNVTVLLDASDPALMGGTGRTIDWSAAATIAARRRVILAGGLRPDNVAAAIETVRPYAVDVSSGVEARPGVKDASLLRAFFAAVEHIPSPHPLLLGERAEMRPGEGQSLFARSKEHQPQ